MKRMLKQDYLIAMTLMLAVSLMGCDDAGTDDGTKDKKSPTSAAIENSDGKELSPENTMIMFIGRHTDKTKDDRKGGFKKFTGTMETTGDGKMPTLIALDIEAGSIWTEFDNLTDHLKSNDFFNVKEFPMCTFKSTEIKPSEDGMCTITGDLTILGNTKSITFPAQVSMEEDQLKLEAEFNIDRTEFGMNYGEDSVEKEVTMTFMIGKANE